MLVRSTFLIVLLAILFSQSVIAQTDETPTSFYTSEGTTESSSFSPSKSTAVPPQPITTPPSPATLCKYPDEFPLFDDTCISRTAYTAIFLTSIILAGLSFLMLLGLLAWYCIRSSSDYSSSYSGDSESNTIALREIPGRTPVEQTTAPYTTGAPVVTPRMKQRRNPNEEPPESHEMIIRQQNGAAVSSSYAPSSSSPKITTPPDERRGRSRTNKPHQNPEKETSYF